MKERKDGFQHLREQLKDFEYDAPATGWKEMSAILDGDKPVPQPSVPEAPRRRFAGWFWLVGAVLLLGGGFWASAQQQWATSPSDFQTTALSALPVPLQNSKTRIPVVHEKTVPPAADAKATPSAVKRMGLEPAATPKQNATVPTALGSAQAAPVFTTLDSTTATIKEPRSPVISPQAHPDTTLEKAAQIFAALDQLPVDRMTALEQEADAVTMPDVVPAALPRWHFGLKAGIDYQALQTNALIGGFAQFRLHPKWVLEAGLQYKRRSANNGDGLGISPPNSDTIYLPTFANVNPFHKPITRVHFWEAPLALRYQISSRLQAIGGIQAAYTRSTDRQLKGNVLFGNSSMDEANGIYTQSPDRSNADDAAATFEQWDFGVLAGLEYRFANRWSLELRLQQGLRDLTPGAYYRNNEIYYNSSLQIAAKWYW